MGSEKKGLATHETRKSRSERFATQIQTGCTFERQRVQGCRSQGRFATRQDSLITAGEGERRMGPHIGVRPLKGDQYADKCNLDDCDGDQQERILVGK